MPSKYDRIPAKSRQEERPLTFRQCCVVVGVLLMELGVAYAIVAAMFRGAILPAVFALALYFFATTVYSKNHTDAVEILNEELNLPHRRNILGCHRRFSVRCGLAGLQIPK